MANEEPKIQNHKLKKIDDHFFELPKDAVNEIYDSFGVDNQVREKVRKAREAIVEDAVDICRNDLITPESDLQDSSTVRIKDDYGEQYVHLWGWQEDEQFDPDAGENKVIDIYGKVEVDDHRPMPESFKEEEKLAKVEEECRQVFEKKVPVINED